MSSWNLPYMESENREEDMSTEELENSVTIMKKVIDELVEQVDTNLEISATSLTFGVIIFLFGFALGLFKIFKKRRSARTVIELESQVVQETTNSTPAGNDEILKIPSTKTMSGAAENAVNASKIELEAYLTDDEILDRPRTPSPNVSELSEITPSRTRSPIARKITSLGKILKLTCFYNIHVDSTPSNRQKIIKTRCPPYRSLANKGRMSPVHNKSKSSTKTE